MTDFVDPSTQRSVARGEGFAIRLQRKEGVTKAEGADRIIAK
jgi:hypothetical protein